MICAPHVPSTQCVRLALAGSIPNTEKQRPNSRTKGMSMLAGMLPRDMAKLPSR
jgi:hypothetical protein